MGECPLCHMIEGAHLFDCPSLKAANALPEMMLGTEIVHLTRWRRDDKFVDQMCRDVMRTRMVLSLAELAELEPDVVIELHAAAASLMEEAPADHDPGFMRGSWG